MYKFNRVSKVVEGMHIKALPLLLSLCLCFVTRICFCAQNPGSVDEGFVPSVRGPVRDLATTPEDWVIVVFQNESTLDGDLVFFVTNWTLSTTLSSEWNTLVVTGFGHDGTALQPRDIGPYSATNKVYY